MTPSTASCHRIPYWVVLCPFRFSQTPDLILSPVIHSKAFAHSEPLGSCTTPFTEGRSQVLNQVQLVISLRIVQVLNLLGTDLIAPPPCPSPRLVRIHLIGSWKAWAMWWVFFFLFFFFLIVHTCYLGICDSCS